ncbi:MAG: glycogen/starch/alpha-glucan phosphorylase [Firmicutes bacterium]|nr:glycogen/starch/alpha-glucan phosphorylase [Bacillota bacterium]
MIKTKIDFITEYSNKLKNEYHKPAESCTDKEKFDALVYLVNDIAAEIKNNPTEASKALGEKKVYYFSMEFLIGKLLENYLINLGIRDVVAEGLEEMGTSLETLCALEPDPGLGNGGLGRLAACFLDSMAAVGVCGDGMGLRYHFGLFKQRIVSGYQVEEPDAWLDGGYPWEKAVPADAITVKFGGNVNREMRNGKMEFKHVDYLSVNAIPYEVPVVGFGGKDVNTLYLWDARPLHDSIDMDAFNRGDYSQAMRERNEIEAITSILYPDDSNGTGKRLRLRQEYFLVAAGMGSIIRNYKAKYGNGAWKEFPDRVSVHINDTHPTMCIPELMRILIDEEGLEWDDAWDITVRTMSFTNHTVLPEALEKWAITEFKALLPRIYMIIEEINRRWQDNLTVAEGEFHRVSRETSALWDNEVKMANLSVIGSHSVNGVSALHSEIIKETIFRDFNDLNPEKFNNKTNGISHRRFMIQANPALAKLINETIGTGWQENPDEMEKLLAYTDNEEVINKLAAVKRENKEKLAKYIADNMHIAVDPDSIFDVQVKRIHAYKRQLLNGLKILNLYNTLKENPDYNINKYTFIIAGKAAQGYAFAKEVIKFLNSLADVINSDEEVNDKIKVVFIENFRVSNAQMIYPAADISEQISTAGKEASGTGNMKFMMNGAITLGTMDGANVEINQLVGDDNMQIFGLSSDETQNYYMNGGYSASTVCENDARIRKMADQMVNGFFAKSGTNFWGIHDELIQHNDEYFVLGDFDSYNRAFENLDSIYNDKMKWGAMSLTNIAKSGFFSSDRTIREYADDIWHTK